MSEYKLITAKDYLYIKIRVHASDYLLRDPNWQKNKRAREAHAKACRDYLKFFEKFVEQFSGYTNEQISYEYAFGQHEASKEIIREKTGIVICNSGGYYIYCIPKTELGQQIFDWILANCLCKCKIIKKTVGTYTDYGVQTWAREMYKTKPHIKAMLDEANAKKQQ